MDDNDAYLTMQQQQQAGALLGNRLVHGGRSKGQPNFKADEDLKLANAYVFVGTNAAVGTDQDGNTFWQKIRDNFIRRGGNPERTIISLQNRFNKVLQCEVQKYIGYLQGALREFHSGWVMEDYVQEAKKQYLIRQGKVFKHEMVYSVLKRGLPKYELVLGTVDARVTRALFLLDNDVIEGQEENRSHNTAIAGSTGQTARAFGTVLVVDNHHDRVSDSALMTPRPSIGKRKAKELAFARSKLSTPAACAASLLVIENKKKADDLKNMRKEKRDVVLNRMADAAEAKNKFAQEQMLFKIYTNNPNSARAKAFFARMEKRYDSEEDTDHVVASSPVVTRHDPACGVRRPTEASLPTNSNNTRGTAACRAAAGYPTRHEFVLDNDDDGGGEEDDINNLPSLPNTQNLMAMVRAMEERTNGVEHHVAGVAAAVDSQETTLENDNDDNGEHDDSMNPNAVLVGDLRDYVTFPPVIDWSRIKGSDFDSDNEDE